MKKYFTYKIFTVFLLVLFICLPVLLHAQPDPNCDPSDINCPIDGGLGFLLAAGIGYGLKKIHSSHKKEASAP